MFQTPAEVHSDVWERRGKKREEEGRRGKTREDEGEKGSERGEDTKNVRLIGSAFLPHDSEGLRKVQNKNWAKG